MKTKQSLFDQGSSSPVYSFPCSFTIYHHTLFSPSILYLIYEVFHFPAFFSWPHASLQMYLPFVFSPFILSWFPFHLPALCSPWDEQPDMQLVPGQNFGINMIFLLTRKNREQFLNWKTVILLLKPQGKRNLGIPRENHFDFPRNHSLQPSLEKILGRSSYY